MASLKELRDRIASVKATQKITKAMQMVAAAKFRLAQEAAEAARPYTEHMETMFQIMVSQSDKAALGPLLQSSGNTKTYLLVICTAERGLCGAFNSQIARFARLRILQLLESGKEVKLFLVGKKGADLLRRDFSHLFLEELSFRELKKIGYFEAEKIAQRIETLFDEGCFDICDLIYSNFVSVLQQTPTEKQLIPVLALDEDKRNEGNSEKKDGADFRYEFEPDLDCLLPFITQKRLRQQIFSALLENVAGEMGAKMTAMDNSTRSAGEMIDKLSVTFNRRRQAKITTELIEIIAGAEAL